MIGHIVAITPDALEALVERACQAAVERALVRQAAAQGGELGVSEVAARLGVSARTVLRMEQRGELRRGQARVLLARRRSSIASRRRTHSHSLHSSQPATPSSHTITAQA